MEDEYTGIDAQHDLDFFMEGYSLQEINEIMELRNKSKALYNFDFSLEEVELLKDALRLYGLESNRVSILYRTLCEAAPD